MIPAAHSPAANNPGHIGHLGIRIHMHAAHDVMGRRADLHRFLGDVDVAERFELMIHARQLALDVLLRVREAFLNPGNIQINAAVLTCRALP